MNLRALAIPKHRRIFDSYSSLDVPVVRKATTYGFALIGGTAVEHMANFYGVKKRRSRSINDLDFISPHDNPHKEHFLNYLKGEGFESGDINDTDYLILLENKKVGVDVDLLFTRDAKLGSNTEQVGAFLVASPIYAFVTKIQRLSLGKEAKKQTDIQDLNTLYDIIEARDEIDELQNTLAEYSFGDIEEDINQWLSENE